MDIICSKCQSQIDDSYNFCPICGEPLNDLAKQRETLLVKTAIYSKIDALFSQISDPVAIKVIKDVLLKD